jgi:hypothetical protein
VLVRHARRGCRGALRCPRCWITYARCQLLANAAMAAPDITKHNQIIRMLFIGSSLACRQAPHRTQGHPFAYSPTQSSIDLIDAAAKGRPFSFRKPCSANSAEIARSDMRPPFGLLRCSRLARATSVGLRSAWLFRPSHLPTSLRFSLAGTAQLRDRHGLGTLTSVRDSSRESRLIEHTRFLIERTRFEALRLGRSRNLSRNECATKFQGFRPSLL